MYSGALVGEYYFIFLVAFVLYFIDVLKFRLCACGLSEDTFLLWVNISKTGTVSVLSVTLSAVLN
jgi:hypothetical protein